MLNKKKILAAVLFLFVVFVFTPTPSEAKPNEYKAIVKHLKSKYRAKKVNIPFVWLARLAVSVVRPAGVKSFSITVFEDLKFSSETLDQEMQSMMRNSFSQDWSPILRVRSKTGEQVYMYMKEAGSSVKVTLVTIDKENAAIIRATLDPDKLAEFMNDPKIFGVSLDDEKQALNKTSDVKDEDKDDAKKN